MNAGDEEQYCSGCGYSLRGLPGPRCPECGLELTASTGARIPWEIRREIGHWKAFWRTVVLGTFRPGRLGGAVGGPVDETSGVRFRRVVLTLVAVGVVGIYLGLMAQAGRGAAAFNLVDEADISRRLYGPGLGMKWELGVLWSAGATLGWVVPTGLAVAVISLSFLPTVGVGTGALNETRLRRARAVCRYAWAPLAWTPVCALAWGGGWAWGESHWGIYLREACLLFMVVVSGCIAVAVVATVWSPVRIVLRATHCGWGGGVLAAINLPLGLILGAAVGIGVMPCVVGLVRIAIDSLR